jgi:hypothetical protein
MSKEIKNRFLRTARGEFIRMDMVVSIRWNDLDKCYLATMVAGYTVSLTADEVNLVIEVGGHMGPLTIE